VTLSLQSRDLDWLSNVVTKHYESLGYQIARDVELWEGAPLIALRAHKGSDDTFVEFRQSPDLPSYLQQFVHEARSRDEPARLYVAVAAPREEEVEEEVSVGLTHLSKLRSLGVGILQASDASVVEIERAVPFSTYIAVATPLRRYPAIVAAAAKFNRGDALDALRDVTERVEGVVQEIAERAVAYGVVNCDETRLAALDLNGQIDMLSLPNYRSGPQVKVFDSTLRADLHSFRAGGRNVAHHAPKTRPARQARDKQLKERLTTGFRLIGELERIRVPKHRR
jgi:hypothetical protein